MADTVTTLPVATHPAAIPDAATPGVSTPGTHTPLVLIERDGPVLTFTLNNPAAGNEVTTAMFDAMIDALRLEAATPAARVLRIRASGAVFCTGRERGGRDALSIHTEVSRLIELKRLVRSTTLITVAQVQGNAYGFGFGLAILCDFTLVAHTAMLAFPEMRKGLPPAAILAYLGSYALPKQVFPLVLFGDAIAPQVALQAGLITAICAPEQLEESGADTIARILALDETGARHCKQFFQQAQENTIEQNFRSATEALTVSSLRLMQNK